MPIEGIDAQIQSLISEAQLKTQQKIDEGEEEEVARKKAEKKLLEKKERLQKGVLGRERFEKNTSAERQIGRALRGDFGKTTKDALLGWQNNKDLQARLTAHQKHAFQKAFTENPNRTTSAAQSLSQMTGVRGFGQAVNSSQTMGTLQAGLLNNPQTAPHIGDLLQSRFMQSSRSDLVAKNQFLQFGFRQSTKGASVVLQQSCDLLDTLTKKPIGKGAQRAAVSMLHRTDGSPKAMDSVDRFVKHPAVDKISYQARDKAVELLCKTNAKPDVREGFERIAAHEKYQAQSGFIQARFYATIGTGRPSEFRCISDISLQALDHPTFPTRKREIGKFLTRVAKEVNRGRSKQMDPKELVRAAKTPILPIPPKLQSTDGMDEEEAIKVRARNRSQVFQFYNRLQRIYDQADRQIRSAKYLEDINRLQNLREAETIDTSVLDFEDQALVASKASSIQQQLEGLRKFHCQRSRELRRKRMPPAKRRAKLAAQRMRGRQPRYFQPNQEGLSAVEIFSQDLTTSAPKIAAASNALSSPAPLSTSDNIHSTVNQAVAQINEVGVISPHQVSQVAKSIASEIAKAVVAQVTEQLLETTAKSDKPQPMNETASSVSKESDTSTKQIQSGKVDGWGIQRSFEPDLGGGLKPSAPSSNDSESSYEGMTNEKYTGRTLVKEGTAVRRLEELFLVTWIEISRAEQALLKNLGWNQQMWDTKEARFANWPPAMETLYANLNATQKNSIRSLNISPHDWDKKVQALKMSKNA